MSRRYGHARFSLYLALPMERTLKAYFVFIPFSYCKKKWFVEAAQLTDMVFFVCMRIYICACKQKKSICSRFRDTNKVCVKINVGYSKTDTLSVVLKNHVARRSKSRRPFL